jgi:hypothetical protein
MLVACHCIRPLQEEDLHSCIIVSRATQPTKNDQISFCKKLCHSQL